MELEMWQEATFDPTQIDKELGWAEAMGMNTMRVFLSTICSGNRIAPGFGKRIDQFLTDCARATTSARCLFCSSIPAGIPRPGLACSTLPFRAYTILVGCKVPARRPWRIRASIHA